MPRSSMNRGRCTLRLFSVWNKMSSRTQDYLQREASRWCIFRPEYTSASAGPIVARDSLDALYSVYVHYTQMSTHNASIRFDPHSSIPAVRQIADSLRILLVERRLAPGDMLPSVRRLAMELGVHFNTVAEAYRELAAEGWLELRHGRKATVIPRPFRARASKNWPDEFRNRLRGLIAEIRAAGAPADKLAAELNAMAKAVKAS